MMASVGEPVGQQRSQLSLVGLETHHAQMSWTENPENLRSRVEGSTRFVVFFIGPFSTCQGPSRFRA